MRNGNIRAFNIRSGSSASLLRCPSCVRFSPDRDQIPDVSSLRFRPISATRTAANSRPFSKLFSGVQLLEQRLRLLQIERVETFGEPAVDRSEQIEGLIPLALIAPEPRQARCGA
jgi:hypothetical protein